MSDALFERADRALAETNRLVALAKRIRLEISQFRTLVTGELPKEN